MGIHKLWLVNYCDSPRRASGFGAKDSAADKGNEPRVLCSAWGHHVDIEAMALVLATERLFSAMVASFCAGPRMKMAED